MSHIRKLFLLTLVLVFTFATAQHSVSISEDINFFKKGKVCFSNQQYAAAVDNFTTFVSLQKSPYDTRIVEAEYYIIYANYYQHKEGIESEMQAFVQKNQGSFYANQISYELGRFYFAEEDYRKAVKAFDPCKDDWFEEEQLATYYYQFAYSLFEIKRYKVAKPLFKKAVDQEDVFYDEALYFYSFLQYKDENYTAALSGFETLMEKGKFEESAPFYAAQIYFLKEEYEKLIEFAPKLISETKNNYEVELNRIVGDAYYQLKNYDKAISYLEAYQNGTSSIVRQDLYHLGVAYYMKKDFAKAAETFAKITAQNDPLSQSAYSYLGECFVKIGDKDRARLAFGTASKYKFDPELREDAYYNYVKLSYETAVSPFNGTIALLEGFLQEFPKSEYTLEINDLMYKSYMTTSNYKDACASIQKIKNKDARLVMAHQRVMYYYGVELYNLGDYKTAIRYFKLSLEGEPLEKNLRALSLFWLGDANYQMKKYDEALVEFNNFITSVGAYSLEEFSIAHYNMGYCFFKINNYNAAINWFRKFTQLDKNADVNLLTDASSRVGDCYYLKRDFYNAIKYYNQALEMGGVGTDYAFYQKGFCQGLSHQYEPKIVTLNILLKDVPESSYADDALYEIARTWVVLERHKEAIVAYKQLIREYPNSKYAAKAMLNSGLVYYNSGDVANATESYKSIVEKYKGTDEARSALSALKNISIDQNSVDEYITYAKGLGTESIEQQEEDSLTFLAAEKLYIAQRYDEALPAFEAYVTDFSNGSYVLVSYFYMADANMQMGNAKEAIQNLEYIVAQPRSIYTEQSLSVLSATYYNEKDYSRALETYKRLLENAEQKDNILAAKRGMMECSYALHEAGATILAVDNLLKEILPPSLVNKAHFYKAKSYFALDNKDAALESYTLLSQDVSNAYGAEAKYTIAQLLFDGNHNDSAKVVVLDFINKGTSVQYWLAKAFVLLSDIYVVENDLFQAKQYLLSISDNYVAEDDILGIVSAKLEIIEGLETTKNLQNRDSLGVHFVAPNDSVNKQ